MHSRRFPRLLVQSSYVSRSLSSWLDLGHILGEVFLIFLFGPPLFLYLWNASDQPSWDAEKHGWPAVAEMVIEPVLLYGALLYLRQPVAWFWSGSFTLIAGWLHDPTIAKLGNTTLWPLTLGNLLFHWILIWPLAPLLTRVLIPRRRTTIRTVQRILTPEEQQAALLPEKSKNTKRPSNRSPQRKRSKKTASDNRAMEMQPGNSTESAIPPPASLRGRVDWRQVPDDNALKQEVMAAAQLHGPARESKHVQVKDTPTRPSPQLRSPVPGASARTRTTGEDNDWEVGSSVLKL